MLRFARLLAISTVALGLTAFQDPAGKFTVDFPADWTPQTGLAAGLSGVQSPDGATNCNAQSNEIPALAALTQDQINAELSKPMDLAGWANIVGIDASKMEVSDTESRDLGGMYMQIATLTLQPNAMGAPIAVKARMAVIGLTGRLVNAGCYTTPEKYDELKDLFEKTVSSVRPL